MRNQYYKNGQGFVTLWNDNPWGGFHKDMDQFLNDFWTPPKTETQHLPACEVEEAKDHYLLSVDMPGISKENVKIEFFENQLVISGERKKETTKEEGGTWYSERRFGNFQRAFKLPPGIDADKIEAHHQDGVLRLMIPKAECTKPKQIRITSGSEKGFFERLLGQSKPEKEESNDPTNERKIQKTA